MNPNTDGKHKCCLMMEDMVESNSNKMEEKNSAVNFEGQKKNLANFYFQMGMTSRKALVLPTKDDVGETVCSR